MKKTKYLVKFVSGEEQIIYAYGGQKAKILAQAEQIKKGNDYEVLSVTNIGYEGVET